ncbi:hypothetical protein BASA50_000519 [Batrachochytrium salamandrivorans]|uniref:Uncharacterized protein n=1 Tax=Batrachochytrium salamandrivorans TaxID=1357716 RepID=A0ABQ8EWW7_9FUNG|nr:hypothetical protein BASA50_000519 [Batrachochytrium salamandrivorans]KAH9275368.1 hypothetical protein BASA83_002141 [Batrachochytrium salamandrivorans]
MLPYMMLLVYAIIPTLWTSSISSSFMVHALTAMPVASNQTDTSNWTLIVDVIGGMPLPSCPYLSSSYSPKAYRITSNISSDASNISSDASTIQLQSFVAHPNPATSFTFCTIAVTSLAFAILTLLNYNQVRIFNRRISHPSVLNRELAAFFFVISISFFIDTVRYVLDTAHASRPIVPLMPNLSNSTKGPPTSYIVGPHVIDAWLLMASSLLRNIAAFLLSLALNKQLKHGSLVAALALDPSNRFSSGTIRISSRSHSPSSRNPEHHTIHTGYGCSSRSLLHVRIPVDVYSPADIADHSGEGEIDSNNDAGNDSEDSQSDTHCVSASTPLLSALPSHQSRSHLTLSTKFLQEEPASPRGESISVRHDALESAGSASRGDTSSHRNSLHSLGQGGTSVSALHSSERLLDLENDSYLPTVPLQSTCLSLDWVKGWIVRLKSVLQGFVENTVFSWPFLFAVLFLVRSITQLAMIDSAAFIDSFQLIQDPMLAASSDSAYSDSTRFVVSLLISFLQAIPVVAFSILIFLSTPLNQGQSSTPTMRVSRRQQRLKGPSMLSKSLFIVGAVLSCMWWFEPSITSRIIQTHVQSTMLPGSSYESNICIVPPWWWLENTQEEEEVDTSSSNMLFDMTDSNASIYLYTHRRVAIQAHGWASWMDVIQWLGLVGLCSLFSAMRLEYKRNMEEWVWITVSEVQNTFDFR